LLVLSKGLVPPLGTLPSAFTAERSRARAIAVLGGPAHAADALEHGASVVVASVDRAFARQLLDVFAAVGLDVSISTDVTGVELAGCAKNVAVLAAAAAAPIGPNVAGAAAGKVFAEVDRIARARGGRPETFTGLAGAGDLVATVVASGSRNRRAGELLSQGVAPDQIAPLLGHAVEAVDSVPLLATAARSVSLETPAIDNLAALVQGRLDPDRWVETVTAPGRSARSRPVRAA
jgi:glycerol-3-phosphate dehydrogenase